MRFGMIDLLFGIACFGVGGFVGMEIGAGLPRGGRLVLGVFTGLGIYALLICPFYRALRLFPMILPRCPCCRNFQQCFGIMGGRYPRIVFRCPGCDGEFVIWHNGAAGEEETWDRPVLALKWPYAFGRFCRLEKPEQRP